jgi:hypothetical protein
MINWKGFVNKRPWPNFKIQSVHSPGGTEENYEKPQDILSPCQKLKPGTSECEL